MRIFQRLKFEANKKLHTYVEPASHHRKSIALSSRLEIGVLNGA